MTAPETISPAAPVAVPTAAPMSPGTQGLVAAGAKSPQSPGRIAPGSRCAPDSNGSLFDRLHAHHMELQSKRDGRREEAAVASEKALTEVMSSGTKAPKKTVEEMDSIIERLHRVTPRSSPQSPQQSTACSFRPQLHKRLPRGSKRESGSRLKLPTHERLYRKAQEIQDHRAKIVQKSVDAELAWILEHSVHRKQEGDDGEDQADVAERLFADSVRRQHRLEEELDARATLEKQALEDCSVHRERRLQGRSASVDAAAKRLNAWGLQRAERRLAHQNYLAAAAAEAASTTCRRSASADGERHHFLRLHAEARDRGQRRLGEEAAAAHAELELLAVSSVSRHASRRPRRPGEVERIFDRVFTAAPLGIRRNVRAPFRQQDAGIPATSAHMSSSPMRSPVSPGWNPSSLSPRSMRLEEAARLNFAQLTDSDLEHLPHSPCASPGVHALVTDRSQMQLAATPASTKFLSDTSTCSDALRPRNSSRRPSTLTQSSDCTAIGLRRRSFDGSSPGDSPQRRLSCCSTGRLQHVVEEASIWRAQAIEMAASAADAACAEDASGVFPRPVGRLYWARSGRDDIVERSGFDINTDGSISVIRGECPYDESYRSDLGSFLRPASREVGNDGLEVGRMAMHRAPLGRLLFASPGTKHHDSACKMQTFIRGIPNIRMQRRKKEEVQAAVTIQKVYRGRKWARWVRECVAYQEEEERRHEQERVEEEERQHAVLEAAHEADEAKRRLAAALAIQRHFRERWGRCFHQDADSDEDDDWLSSDEESQLSRGSCSALEDLRRRRRRSSAPGADHDEQARRFSPAPKVRRDSLDAARLAIMTHNVGLLPLRISRGTQKMAVSAHDFHADLEASLTPPPRVNYDRLRELSMKPERLRDEAKLNNKEPGSVTKKQKLKGKPKQVAKGSSKAKASPKAKAKEVESPEVIKAKPDEKKVPPKIVDKSIAAKKKPAKAKVNPMIASVVKQERK